MTKRGEFMRWCGDNIETAPSLFGGERGEYFERMHDQFWDFWTNNIW